MLKKIASLAAVALVAFSLEVAAQQPAPAAPPPIKRTILQRADIPGTNMEVIYATVEIGANFKAGKHTHPGIAMGHVVEGDFWMAVDGEPEKILKPGDSLTVPVRAAHNEGAMDKPVKLNVVYVVEKGQPLASPVQ